MLTLHLIVAINGLTFALISILIGFFNYINTQIQTITAPIEVLAYLLIAIIMSAVCFRQLTFWLSSMFVPNLNT